MKTQETKLLKASVVDYRHSFPAWPDVAAHIPLAYIEGRGENMFGALEGFKLFKQRSFHIDSTYFYVIFIHFIIAS